MQISDVIADMLTRIRNANDAKHATVDIPASNMKKEHTETVEVRAPERMCLRAERGGNVRK